MDPELSSAYHQTTYVASTPRGRLRVRIGESHPQLDALLDDLDADKWAYITAWNPGSQLLGPWENHERQRTLEAELRDEGYAFFRGSGVPDVDDWDPEESVLVVGISRPEAARLGRKYAQNAIVYGRAGQPAELVWCDSPNPPAEEGTAGVEASNILAIPDELPGDDEFFEVLAQGDAVRVERIISHGHRTPDGQWYDQDTDEWVVLVQGEATLAWADGTTTTLRGGEAVFIAAHRRHRVVETSAQPPCVWLAVHASMTQES